MNYKNMPKNERCQIIKNNPKLWQRQDDNVKNTFENLSNLSFFKCKKNFI